MLKVYFILGLFVNFTNICQSVQDKEWDLLYLLKKENNIHLSDDITLSLSGSTNYSQFILAAKQIFSQNNLPSTFVVYIKVQLKTLTISPMTIFSLRDPNNKVRFQMKLRMIPGFIKKTELNVVLNPVSSNGIEVNVNFTLPFIHTDIWTFGMLFKSSKITLYAVCDDINRTFGYQTMQIPSGLGKMLFSEGAVMHLFSDDHQTDLLEGEIYEITFANFFRKLNQICNQGGIEGSGGHEKQKIERKSPGNHLLVTEKMDEDDTTTETLSTTTETLSTTNFRSVTSSRKSEREKTLIKQIVREKNATVEKDQVLEFSMNDMDSSKSDGKIFNKSLQSLTIKTDNKKNITFNISKNHRKEFSEVSNMSLIRKTSMNLETSSSVKKTTIKQNALLNSTNLYTSTSNIGKDEDDLGEIDLNMFDIESTSGTLTTEKLTDEIKTDSEIRYGKSTRRNKIYDQKLSNESLQNDTVINNNVNKKFKMENSSIKEYNTVEKAINILTQNPNIRSTTIPVLDTSSMPPRSNTNSGTSTYVSSKTQDKLNYEPMVENKEMSSTEKSTKYSKSDKISSGLIETSKESSQILTEVTEITYDSNSQISVEISKKHVSEGTEGKTSNTSPPQETDETIKVKTTENSTILQSTTFPIYSHSKQPVSNASGNITHKYFEHKTSDNLKLITESNKETKTTSIGSTKRLMNTTYISKSKSSIGKVKSKYDVTQQSQTVTPTSAPQNSTIFSPLVPNVRDSAHNLSKATTESIQTGIYNHTKERIILRISGNLTEFDQNEYTSTPIKVLEFNETKPNGTFSKITTAPILFNKSINSLTRQSESQTSTHAITSSTRKVKTEKSTTLSSMKLDTRLPMESNKTLGIIANGRKNETNKYQFYTTTNLSLANKTDISQKSEISTNSSEFLIRSTSPSNISSTEILIENQTLMKSNETVTQSPSQSSSKEYSTFSSSSNTMEMTEPSNISTPTTESSSINNTQSPIIDSKTDDMTKTAINTKQTTTGIPTSRFPGNATSARSGTIFENICKRVIFSKKVQSPTYSPSLTILQTSTIEKEKTQPSESSQDECSVLSKLRLSIPQKGAKGERGLKGDIGEKGDRGPSGINGVCDASICSVNLPSKGDKGDPGQCNKSQCLVIKGERGPIGLKGDMGQKGERGESNDINIELIRYLTHSIIKAQIESMTLFQNGKGEKGEPGACKCAQKVPDKSFNANDIYEENVNIGYGSLVFETRELLEQTSNRLPAGSMVYISQSDIFLIKIDQSNNVWRTISMEPKSRTWILPIPMNIPKHETTYPPYQNGFSKKLHLIALITPTMGDLKPMLRQPGGYSGAAFQCQQAGEMYGYGRFMHPFINTDPFHLKFSINQKHMNLPIYNSRGETLASNFNALLSGNDDLQNEILDFKKEPISRDILSQCVWLGKEPSGNDIEYNVKTESRCVNWMSREPHIHGLAAFINSTKSLFDEYNRGLLSCSRQCYVLCIQTEPYDL